MNLEHRVTTLETRPDHHDDVLYQHSRDLIRLNLGMDLLLTNFGLAKPTAEQVDAVLEERS